MCLLQFNEATAPRPATLAISLPVETGRPQMLYQIGGRHKAEGMSVSALFPSLFKYNNRIIADDTLNLMTSIFNSSRLPFAFIKTFAWLAPPDPSPGRHRVWQSPPVCHRAFYLALRKFLL